MTRVGSASPPERPVESLRSSSDFGAVLRQGVRNRTGGLTVVSLRRDHTTVRIGLVAGKRLGSAITRNRIKRRLRHAWLNLDLEPGWDHVVIPTPSVATAPFGDVVSWLQRGIDRSRS